MKPRKLSLFPVMMILSLCLFLFSACGSPADPGADSLAQGNASLAAEDYEQAIEYFSQAISENADLAGAWYGRGVSYLRSKTDKESLQAAQSNLEKAVSLDPSMTDAWLALSDLAVVRQDLEEAYAVLDRAAAKGADETAVEEKRLSLPPLNPPVLDESALMDKAISVCGEDTIVTNLFVDMDGDGLGELTAVTQDEDGKFHVWFVGSDGESCEEITASNDRFDLVDLVPLKLDTETHVGVNYYTATDGRKNFTVLALHGSAPSTMAANQYGYILQDPSGAILLNVEDYDIRIDGMTGIQMGHSYKDTYLFYENNSYKEYGATELTKEEFLAYANADYTLNLIEGKVRSDDTIVSTEYSYFRRANGVMHIQCAATDSGGTVHFSYYTVPWKESAITDQPGDPVEGQMRPFFSTLEVVY